jgi:hypothetical protein
MIHQLAQVIARVLKLSEVKHFDEALEEIQTSSRQLVGMEARLLTSLSDTEIIRLMSLGDRFDAERCVAAAELLRMTGKVNALQGREAMSHHCYVTSLSLFLELLLRETGTLPKEYFDKVECTIQEVVKYELPLALQRKLFQYYEDVGKFDLAENVLFEIIQEEPEFVQEGMKFYGRLRTKTDEELQKGNLPRHEVEESMKDLEGWLRRT